MLSSATFLGRSSTGRGETRDNSEKPKPRDAPKSDAPVFADFSSDKLTIAAGVAIFHVASARVVLCWHTREKYWFLPKGRRDVNEDSGVGAEREGFEEVGNAKMFILACMKT